VEQPSAPPPPTVIDHLSTPVATYVIMGLTALIYILQFGSETLLGTDLPALLGMKINELIVQGQLWRLLTPMLLHGSILHIGFNMYALLSIGQALERRFGTLTFVTLYIVAGFSGNVLSFLFSVNPSLGASTAIFGLLGAEIVFLYQNRELFGKQASRDLQNVLSVAAVNFIIGLSPGIDNWGHLGGLLGGLVFTWFAGPKLTLEGMYPRFEMVNERGASHALAAGALVLILFSAAAAGRILGAL
jgi:rhomboid protease GluP